MAQPDYDNLMASLIAIGRKVAAAERKEKRAARPRGGSCPYDNLIGLRTAATLQLRLAPDIDI
jgi:hypothetical protein